MDRGAWWGTVHGVTKSQTQLSNETTIAKWISRPSTYADSTKVKVVVAQSCPTLRSPLDCSPPGSSVHGILQVRILEWVPCLSPGGLPDPGIKPCSPALGTDCLPSEPAGIQPSADLNFMTGNPQWVEFPEIKPWDPRAGTVLQVARPLSTIWGASEPGAQPRLSPQSWCP